MSYASLLKGKSSGILNRYLGQSSECNFSVTAVKGWAKSWSEHCNFYSFICFFFLFFYNQTEYRNRSQTPTDVQHLTFSPAIACTPGVRPQKKAEQPKDILSPSGSERHTLWSYRHEVLWSEKSWLVENRQTLSSLLMMSISGLCSVKRPHSGLHSRFSRKLGLCLHKRQMGKYGLATVSKTWENKQFVNVSSQHHMAYFWVHSRAILLYFSVSVL